METMRLPALMRDVLLGDQPGNAHIGASLVSSAAAVVFAWNQNRVPGIVGGPIHWSKAAWLNITVQTFAVLPWLWWRSSTAGPAVRRVLGTTFVLFALRGAAEYYLIYVTRKWKCGYGISHDALVCVVMAAMLLQSRSSLIADRDRRAIAFCLFTMAMLIAEANFAKMFREVQDPATGIYFADDSPKFRKVVRTTKVVVAISYPVLALILWRARRDFPRARTRGRAGATRGWISR